MRLQYASTIDNFDELINSRMLARHFLGPKPSPYVLCAIAREEKSKCLSFSTLVLLLPTLLLTFCLWWSFAGMTAKFNQKLYAKLRAKKNEPLSSLAQKQPQAGKEVVETTASTPVASDPNAASLATFVEEIIPRPKRACGSNKGKSKVESNIQDNAATTMGRAHNVITLEELKGLNSVPSHKLVIHHIRKLVQVHSRTLSLS